MYHICPELMGQSEDPFQDSQQISTRGKHDLSLLEQCHSSKKTTSIFFCLLLNVSLISFPSSAHSSVPSLPFSLHILPSCSSSPSSSLASCVTLHTQNRQNNLTTNLNQTKIKSNSLPILKATLHLRLPMFVCLVVAQRLPRLASDGGQHWHACMDAVNVEYMAPCAKECG